jgi:hypothetical protein
MGCVIAQVLQNERTQKNCKKQQGLKRKATAENADFAMRELWRPHGFGPATTPAQSSGSVVQQGHEFLELAVGSSGRSSK